MGRNLLKRIALTTTGCERLLAGVFVLLTTFANAHADTTWVSGRVYGVWTLQGSPYVITDSTWVDRSQTLLVTGGVTIVLPNPESVLYVVGTCDMSGAEDDTIRFMAEDENSGINSASGYSPATLIRAAYVSFTGPGRTELNASLVTLEHTVHEGRCYVTSGAGAGVVTLHHCSFPERLSVTASEAHIDSVVFGQSVSLNGTSGTVNHLVWDSCWAPYDGDLDIWTWRSVSCPTVTDCDVHDLGVDWYGLGDPVVIQGTRVHDRFEASDLPNLLLDGCRIPSLRLASCSGTISRCLINEGVFSGPVSLGVYNNTFLWGEACSFEGTGFLCFTSSQVSFRNNIFCATDPRVVVLGEGCPDLVPPPRYNLTWGMSNPWREHVLGPGNISEDPLLDPNRDDGSFQYGSAARNRGDPALRDPDQSRSDIGAWWWDHRYDHPPVISTPNYIETGWGRRLTVVISASDEHGVRLVLPSAVPYWFSRATSLDEETSRLLVSCRIPYGVPPVSIPVTAVDDSGQTDTDTIRLDIYPASVLEDTVSGTLVREYSPYVALCEVTIPAGDTLVIEPGVCVRRRINPCDNSLTVRGGLVACGMDLDSVRFDVISDEYAPIFMLRVEGPDAWFNMDRCAVYSGYLNVAHASRCSIANSTFHNLMVPPPIMSWSMVDTLFVVNCAFPDTSRLLFQGSSFVLERCDLSRTSTLEGYYPLVECDSSRGIIRACRFGPHPDHTISVVGQNAEVWIERNLFHGGCITTTDFTPTSVDGTIHVVNNTFLGDSSVFVRLPHFRGDSTRSVIVNNIFAGSRRSVFWCANSDTHAVVIADNCFWQNARLFVNSCGTWERVLGHMVTTNINGDSTDIYGNIFLDPLFADSMDYHLSAESPCIDAGIDVGLPFAGQAPDIGYWEYGTSSVRRTDEGPPTLLSLEPCIYPNPVNGPQYVTICLPVGMRGREIRVYNVLGQQVECVRLDKEGDGPSTALIPVSRLVSGLYFVTAEEERGARTRPLKFIVLK
jgi:hypothetical protein